MTLTLGLDLGTTRCKALALSDDGRILAAADSIYQYQPHLHPAEQVEQDAHQVWQGATEALRALAAELGPTPPAALCLSGAMHTLMPVAADGTPLAPATTWADQRAAAQVRELRSQVDPVALYRRTGCPLQPEYHPARLHWYFADRPQLARRTARFVAIKDWGLFQLTGKWVTDHCLASSTGLLDIHHLEWDAEALRLGGITSNQLPELVQPEAVIGKLTPSAAEALRLPAGLPIVAGSSDGALAMLGAGATNVGDAVVNLSTSGAVRLVVDQPRLDPAERTWCYALPGSRAETGRLWIAGGAISNAGLALDWLRELLYADSPEPAAFERMLTEALDVPLGAAGVVMLPYFAGARSPEWNADARAALCGLQLRHTRAHIARAALEGIAFGLAQIWDAFGLSGDEAARPAFLTGLPAREPAWAQLLADVLGAPLVPVAAADASALGAAMLAFHAIGQQSVLRTIAPIRHPQPVVQPDAGRHAAYAEVRRTYEEVYRRLF